MARQRIKPRVCGFSQKPKRRINYRPIRDGQAQIRAVNRTFPNIRYYWHKTEGLRRQMPDGDSNVEFPLILQFLVASVYAVSSENAYFLRQSDLRVYSNAAGPSRQMI